MDKSTTKSACLPYRFWCGFGCRFTAHLTLCIKQVHICCKSAAKSASKDNQILRWICDIILHRVWIHPYICNRNIPMYWKFSQHFVHNFRSPNNSGLRLSIHYSRGFHLVLTEKIITMTVIAMETDRPHYSRAPSVYGTEKRKLAVWTVILWEWLLLYFYYLE